MQRWSELRGIPALKASDMETAKRSNSKLSDPRAYFIARELVHRGLSATLYSACEGEEGNEVLYLRKSGRTSSLVVADLSRRSPQAQISLMSPPAYTPPPPRAETL